MNTANIKQAVANELWLSYFNSYLYERGVITEAERNKMKNLIHSKCHAQNTKKIPSRC